MPEQNKSTKKKLSLDWLMRGVLTKVGDTFDRLTGRRWAPSSSLATSELIERLKALLDAEVKDQGAKGKFVPHNIKLKMQWDKFSTDAAGALKKLENELLVAAIDHINDNRYHTYAPLRLEVKPDYFTEGVKLLASYDKFDDEEREVAINVTVPQIQNVGNYIPEPPPEDRPVEAPETFVAHFTLHGKARQVPLKFKEKERRSVGRTKENELNLEDPSVSKIHAALVLNSDKQLMVADTGSTNGTFIDDQRIAYGRAFVVADGARVKFGNVDVVFARLAPAVEPAAVEPAAGENFAPPVSASQRDVQTVAYNSTENAAPVGPPAEKFSTVAPEKAAQPATGGTQDRIMFDFSNEEK